MPNDTLIELDSLAVVRRLRHLRQVVQRRRKVSSVDFNVRTQRSGCVDRVDRELVAATQSILYLLEARMELTGGVWNDTL